MSKLKKRRGERFLFDMIMAQLLVNGGRLSVPDPRVQLTKMFKKVYE